MKKRLAIMIPRFSKYGGVEQYGYNLAAVLASHGYSVDVICARSETVAPEGVTVIELGRPRSFKVIKMLYFLYGAEKIRKKNNYDLSISLGKTWNQDIARIGGGPLPVFWRLSQEAWAQGFARLAKKVRRISQPANWLTLFIEDRLFRKTSTIVAISDSVKDWILEVYPHLANKQNSRQELLTIYNCPDMAKFRAPTQEEKIRARENFKIPAESYALGLATSNFALKGLEPLINCLPLLEHNICLHIAGGRNPARYQKLAVSLGLGSRVIFHGKIDDMQGFYHALDMFILPSFYDTLGNVVLEAMSSGLPTLCSNRAGASAFLPPERIITNPANIHELAEKIAATRQDTRVVPFIPKDTGFEAFISLIEKKLNEKTHTSE